MADFPHGNNEVGRRGFLALTASGAATLLTGCADPQAVLILNEATDEELADTAREVGSDEEGSEIVGEAVKGNGTYVGSGRVPPMRMEGSQPVLYDGRYYDVHMESEKVSEDAEYVLRVEYVGDESVEGETEYDALPEADRDALSELLPPEEPEGFEDETGRLYTEDERDESVLVGDGTRTVVVEGARYAVETERGETVDRNEYVYEFEEVADSRDEYVSWMRDELTFVLSDLSDDERAVVSEAIDGGYYEGGANDAFESLVGRFRDHRAIRSDEWGGEWLVEYDDTVYLADLRHSPSAIE
jgi:hypothetical protein